MKFLALAIVAFGIGVIPVPQILGQPIEGVIQQHGPSHAHPAQKTTNEEQAAEDEAIGSIFTLVAQIEQIQAQRAQAEESVEDEAKNIERKLVTYTGWLVAVGGLQALILLGTVLAIIQQTRAHQNSERAWLIISVQIPRVMQKLEHIQFGSNPFGGDQLSAGFGFDWSVQNIGKSTALITRIGARFHPVSSFSELPNEPDIEVPNLVQPTAHFPYGFSIRPAGTVNKFTFSIETLPMAEQRKRTIDGTVIWVAYGLVEYRTIFSRRKIKTTRFCYVWKPAQPGQFADGFERSDMPSGYTKQT